MVHKLRDLVVSMSLERSDTSKAGQTSISEDAQIRQIIENAWNSKVQRSGVPPRYRGAECVLGLKMYRNAVEKGVGAYLYGAPGTGKTYAACASVLLALKDGKNARYVTTYDLMAKLKDEFGEKKWVASQITSAWLLVLDEAGEGDDTKWDVPKMFDILNDRYNRMLPTVICSNYAPDELMRQWHVEGVKAQRVLSRLSEMCVMRQLEGADRRLG